MPVLNSKSKKHPRLWNTSSCEPDDFYYSAKACKSMHMPEPPVEPAENDAYITAGCGHEIYEGEEVFEWENGATLCSDCLEDRFFEMSLSERAELLGCEHRAVSFSKRDTR